MIFKSDFKAATGLSNPHLQTILPAVFRFFKYNKTYPEIFELRDGDFVDLAWSDLQEDKRPIVVIFHGLEGCAVSPYIKGLLSILKKQDYRSVVMHFRGCSGRLNRHARSYHSGDTGDAIEFLTHLRYKYPDNKLAAVGYSLGGNMLLKLQGELAEKSPLVACVSVCAPLDLAHCADRLEQGSSRFYQRYLVNQLIRKIRVKLKDHNYKKLINLNSDKLDEFKSFWEFDNHITAPLHGFKSVHEYYYKASARRYLQYIQQPALLIQSLDDPFMSIDMLPHQSELSEFVDLELSRYGGHVGFISGSILMPKFWLDKRISDYLSNYLN